ncbi:amino acid adenylation domain-containing protein [Saccharothrix coeruleofusca]|uniref:non-ribosomal peptide synthetase n=1 Tax=Saccharothrix coeruleofusca TaxID=33919 RepID=UPI001AE1D226|nr:amino acid adenylation domain-containing protein [Saccharothrix coeruleofusca]MBP2336774.1 amino acid adenylation domain-containing protein [Saccharothrix coeruleofusca]
MANRVLDLFEEQAAVTPDAVALVFDGVEQTYAELDLLADRYATLLRAAGVRRGDAVGLLLARGPDLPAAMLGVWKAGGAYVPLTAATPAERIGRVLATAQARAVVTGGVLADRLDGVFDGPRVRSEDLAGAERVRVPGERADLAYVMFTSGSTGEPKGVQISHGALINLLKSMGRLLDAEPAHAWLASTAVSFDISGLELHLPLTTGGRVVLADEEQAADGPRLLELVDKHSATHVQATPSGWKLLLAAGFARPDVVALVGGEELPATLARRLRPAVGRLVNVYGPTETTIWSTSWPVPDPVEHVRIGRPIANTRLYVLDARGRRLPVGVTGELYIAGDGVARGYAGRPALTAERFLPEPFGPRAGGRMYRTGDLARFTADGGLEFLGRADHQVKVRGHRVELGEIEAGLLKHPAVADAVVVARDLGEGEKALVGYVVPAADATADPADLAAFLGESLPAYMVPSAFVSLPEFPLSTAGKVNRGALPAPDRDATAAGRPYQEPATATERKLAALWQEVLGVTRIGRDDRFFDLGGDSTRVVKFLAVAQEAGVSLSLATLYQHDTIAELGRQLDGHTARRGLSSPEPVMAEHGIPAVSIAVINGGGLVAAHTYGALTPGGAPTTPDALFQVGSISKHVTALAVLRLVGEGRLDLDTDVNEYLTSWRVPYAREDSERVTPRLLMANLSGLSVTSNESFPRSAEMPTVLDLLQGTPPAEPPRVFVEGVPGRDFVKHNTHSAVLQQVLVDVVGVGFAELMAELVLRPLGMDSSSYDFAHPETSGLPVALGHDADGAVLDGGWRNRSTQAAAGLWTTASDLARVAVEIREAHLGGSPRVLTRETAEQMLTVAHPGSLFGLGTSVDPTGADLEYGHVGESPGYRAVTLSRLRAGSGLVVLTNSDSGREAHKFVATHAAQLVDGLGAGLTTAHEY